MNSPMIGDEEIARAAQRLVSEEGEEVLRAREPRAENRVLTAATRVVSP
jgi:hypothetical protein